MTRLDWDRVAREKKTRGRRRPKGKKPGADRQILMGAFVKKHDLACFGCGQSNVFEWAKTGISRRGPWAICGKCVNKR